jgi:hypothetical protein
MHTQAFDTYDFHQIASQSILVVAVAGHADTGITMRTTAAQTPKRTQKLPAASPNADRVVAALGAVRPAPVFPYAPWPGH